MTGLPWPQLFDRLRSTLDLKGDGKTDGEGWIWARCPDVANHRNGDMHHSLRINAVTGGVKCMSQDCPVGPNLNQLAARLGVDGGGAERQGTLDDLASPRRLLVDVLRDRWGVFAAKDCWVYAIDDPDAKSVRRLKRFPWRDGPKYSWQPKGAVRAADLVYNLSHLAPDADRVIVCAGEPDTWVMDGAGFPAISFLAGENTAPSRKAVEKLKAATPQLASVYVIYDKDPAGQRGAHRVGEALVTAGLDVSLLQLPDDLPEKGDVTDLWVRLNGEREAFRKAILDLPTTPLEKGRPAVEQTDDDAFQITLPAAGGLVRFDFRSVERGARRLEAEVSISVALPGLSPDTYTVGVNTASLSGREGLRRQLEAMWPDLDWTALINSAFGLLRSAYFGADVSIDLAEVPDRDPTVRYRVGTLLPEGQPTIIFGDGATGKTYISLALCLGVALGNPALGLATVQGRILFIDYETDAGNARFRVGRILAGLGIPWQPELVTYWPAKGRPLADIVDAIKRKVRRDNIDLIIIDSAAAACGGEPEKAENALRFFNALAGIGATSLSLAHVPKDSDESKPFGSVFWHNMARSTWNVKRAQQEGEDEIHVGLFNRKANDARLSPPIGLRITFDGETGPVTIDREDVRDVPAMAEHLSLRDRILKELQNSTGPKSVDQLATATGGKSVTVRARLNEMKGKRVVRLGSDDLGLWGLIEGHYD